jgi:hypothetical protein
LNRAELRRERLGIAAPPETLREHCTADGLAATERWLRESTRLAMEQLSQAQFLEQFNALLVAEENPLAEQPPTRAGSLEL